MVESCVNQVGVNLNTASYQLLAHVSGIGPALAQRDRRAPRPRTGCSSRATAAARGAALLEEGRSSRRPASCACPRRANPLDNTGVHPERYAALERLAARAGRQHRGAARRGRQAGEARRASFKRRGRRLHLRRHRRASWRSRAAIRATASCRSRSAHDIHELEGPAARDGLPRHRHQRHQLRRVRRHRRPPGRPGPHLPARRPVRQGSARGGERRRPRHRARPRGEARQEADRADHEGRAPARAQRRRRRAHRRRRRIERRAAAAAAVARRASSKPPGKPSAPAPSTIRSRRWTSSAAANPISLSHAPFHPLSPVRGGEG